MKFTERVGAAWQALTGKSAGSSSSDAPENMMAKMLPQRQPPRRGTRELLNAYGEMPWLRTAVSRVSYKVAAIPWMLYAVRPAKGERAIKYVKAQHGDPQSRRLALKQAQAKYELEEIDSHPLLDLLNNANPEMTGLTARKTTQMWLELVGEGPWLLERNALGTPIAYWPIPPHWVSQVSMPGNPFVELTFGGFRFKIPDTEFIYFRDPDPVNPYGRGSGLAMALGDELETDEYAAKHTKTWFYNKAMPPVIVASKDMPKDEAKRLEEDWNRKNRGFWNAFKTYFTSAELQIHELTQTFADQQLVELRKFERDTIIQVFGVPPEILGIVENSNRATIEAATLIFAEQVLEPRLELMREIMQVRLVPEFDERLILDYVSPVPRDQEYELKAGQAAPFTLLLDEWRELQGLEPLPDGQGQVLMVPFNLIPMRIEELSAEPPEPEEPDDSEEDAKAVVKDALLDIVDVYEILEAVDEEHISYRVHPKYKEIIEDIGQQTLDEYGIQLSFNLQDPRVKYWLEHDAGTMIRHINETTLEALRETLAEGVHAGEGIPKLAKRVSTVFADAKGRRATVIARTETLRASNFAAHEGMEQGGIEKKEWIATQDSRVRDTHAAADGQIVNMAESFLVGGYPAKYPCDPDLPPEESIQCRCTVAGVIEDKTHLETEEKREAYWKARDRRAQSYERPFRTALIKGLQAQQDTVMDKLKELGAKEDD